MVVKKILGLASVSVAPLPVWYIRCWDNISTVLLKRHFGIYYIQHPDSAAWLSRKYWVWHLLVLPHCLSDTSNVGTTFLQYFREDFLVDTIYVQHPDSAAWLSRKYWVWHPLVLPHCLSDTSVVGTTFLQYFWEDFLVDITVYTTSGQCCMVVKKILGLASVSAAPLAVWCIRCCENISTILSKRLFGRYYIQHPDSAAWLSRKYWVWHLLVLPHCLSDASTVGTTSLQYFQEDFLVDITVYTTSGQCWKYWV